MQILDHQHVNTDDIKVATVVCNVKTCANVTDKVVLYIVSSVALSLIMYQNWPKAISLSIENMKY